MSVNAIGDAVAHDRPHSFRAGAPNGSPSFVETIKEAFDRANAPGSGRPTTAAGPEQHPTVPSMPLPSFSARADSAPTPQVIQGPSDSGFGRPGGGDYAPDPGFNRPGMGGYDPGFEWSNVEVIGV